jgi:serine/threonine-protein kinase 24/25/MST4
LWDFGTVRSTARPSTIGRAGSVQVSGPPLTWDYNKTSRSRGSSGSGASIAGPNGPRRAPNTEMDNAASSSTARAAGIQPLPSSERSSRRVDQQATVRHGVVGSNEGNGVQREPSDEYDDLEDHLPEDDLPDTTMLDSVVLPAIASVRQTSLNQLGFSSFTFFFFIAFPPRVHTGSPHRFERSAEGVYGC